MLAVPPPSSSPQQTKERADAPRYASRPRRRRRHPRMTPMPMPSMLTGYHRPRANRSRRPKRRCGDSSPRPRRGRDTRPWPPGPLSRVCRYTPHDAHCSSWPPVRVGSSALSIYRRFSHLFAIAADTHTPHHATPPNRPERGRIGRQIQPPRVGCLEGVDGIER